MTKTNLADFARNKALLCLAISLHIADARAEMEVRGNLGLEQRVFLQNPLDIEQKHAQGSVFLQPEFGYYPKNTNSSLLFQPFVRLDQEDRERSHFDIRELSWLYASNAWEMRLGVSKVFWGHTESLHLVDVINQTDSVDSVDGESKLGQPMVHVTWFVGAGSLQAFVLPYFRERTFSGIHGRLRPQVPVNADKPLFESEDEAGNIDYALRFEQSFDSFEIGLSVFSGTNREPLLVAARNASGEVSLRPFYTQVTQYGLDALYISGNWAWKLESIYRKRNSDTELSPEFGVVLGASDPKHSSDAFHAAVGGFEYTKVGVFGSTHDLGVLVEYQFDERSNSFFAPAQNDAVLGFRWALNDIDSTEVLFGLVQDLDFRNSRAGFIEASSRISDNWSWSIEGYYVHSNEPSESLFLVRKDDFFQFGVEYYF